MSTESSNRLNLQQGRLRLDVKNMFLPIKVIKFCNSLPRGRPRESPSLVVFTNRLDRSLSGMVWIH